MNKTATYEVRCERCQTSFAPETRRCVHCGGPLGGGRIFASIHAAHGIEVAQEDEELEGTSPARNRMWVVMAVMALFASLARTCGD